MIHFFVHFAIKKVVSLFMGCDLDAKKTINCTDNWNQQHGCDHCNKLKEVHEGRCCWSGKSGAPRVNPTKQSVSQDLERNCEFQRLEYCRYKVSGTLENLKFQDRFAAWRPFKRFQVSSLDADT